MKYRIIKEIPFEGIVYYYIQKKLFGLFWVYLIEWDLNRESLLVKYNDLHSAQHRIKQEVIKRKKNKIFKREIIPFDYVVEVKNNME